MSDQPPNNHESAANDQPDSNKKRFDYDYSRSSSRAGSHWYGIPGQADPLNAPHMNNQAPRYPVRPDLAQKQQQPSQPISPTRARIEARRAQIQQLNLPDNWAWVVIAIAALGLTLIMSLILIVTLRSGNDDAAVASLNQEPLLEPTSIIYGDEGNVGGALAGNSMVIEPWNGSERFTVLLMGLDNRPGESELCRTDTMIVLSINPDINSIGILSIPRDTYVEVPNIGLRKINTACVVGELDQRGSGPKLAMQTVQYNFGIRVNEYVMIDFNTFISLIDRIGGVTVNVAETIDDPLYPDMNYGYDAFYLEAGIQDLDGETALKYARSRHTSDDIDRARRQQQIIFAARDKALSIGMLDDLALQAPAIWNDLNDGIETGMSLNQIIELALYVRDIPLNNINNGVVSWDYLRSHQTAEGSSVLIPKREALIPLMLEIFGEGYNQ